MDASEELNDTVTFDRSGDEAEAGGAADVSDVEVGVADAAGAGAGAGAAAPAAAPSKPRLIMHKMTFEGFKSYGPYTELGPFDASMSAVVGANGSGKSNFIDGLMFVLGSRAKQLRHKKLSELIHKSNEYPDLPSCKVEVHFQLVVDNEDGTAEYVPDSAFVVSRIAFKDSTSKYYVNNKTSLFTKVTTLLKEHGVDLDHNRFLILQGEVEQISMMPPKGRTPHEVGLLEYFEDITGSCKFVEPIEEAAKEVEELSEARLVEYKRCKAVESEKDSLEAAKTEAVTFLQLERKVLVVRYTLATKQFNEEDAKLEEAKTNRQSMVDELSALAEEVKAKATDASGIEEEYKAAKKAAEAARAVEKKQREAFAALEKKDIQTRESMKHLSAQAKKHSAARKREEKKSAEAAAKGAAVEASLPKLEAKLEKCTRAKAKADAVVDDIQKSLLAETAELRDAVDAKAKELEPWREKATAVQGLANSVQTQMQILTDRMQASTREVETHQQYVAEVADNRVAATAEVARCEKLLSAGRVRLEAATAELADVTAAETKVQESVRTARATFEERKQAFASSSTRSTLVTKVMEATRRGGALASAGVYGRLGDLGSIDKKYDVAISTAARLLDAFVVQTADGCAQVLRFLRSIGGRAKVVILDELSEELAARMARHVSPPRSTQRLCDLITTDDKFKLAFYLDLGDTLVAESWEAANTAAYGRDGNNKPRQNIVALNGHLISASGTMSGGGRVRRGGMGSAACETTSEAEVREAETSLEAATAELEALKARKQDLTAEIKTLKKELPQVEVSMSKAQMELNSCDQRLVELKARLAELEGVSTEPDAADVASLKALEKDLAKHTKALNAANKKAAKLEAEVAALQAQVLDAGGPRLKDAKDKATAAEQAVAEAERAITQARVDVKAATKTVAKSDAAAAKAEAEIEAAKQRLQELKEEAEQLCEKAVAVDEAAKAAADDVAEKVRDQAQVKKQLDKLMTALTAIRDKEMDLTHAVEKATDAIAACKSNRAMYKTALEDVTTEFKATLFADEIEEDDTPSAAGTSAGVEEEKAAPDGDATAADDSGEADPTEEAEEEALIRALPDLSEADLDAMDITQMQRQLTMLEAQRDEAKSSVHLTAIQDYRKKAHEHKIRLEALAAVSGQRDTARKVYEKLRKQRLDLFMSAFSVITMKLKEMYQMITLGGDAELELVDSLDPFSEGIVFSVRPPNKSWKNISNLSGGEKTLSSLALVFALHHYKPTPLYVMDEIDAALDFKNVSIIANYIKERTKDAQFVIISLRNNMFELADRLIGIYKTNDVTKSVAINPLDFVVPAIAPAPRARKTGAAGRSRRTALADRSNTAATVM